MNMYNYDNICLIRNYGWSPFAAVKQASALRDKIREYAGCYNRCRDTVSISCYEMLGFMV